jgi:hypothetical protein
MATVALRRTPTPLLLLLLLAACADGDPTPAERTVAGDTVELRLGSLEAASARLEAVWSVELPAASDTFGPRAGTRAWDVDVHDDGRVLVALGDGRVLRVRADGGGVEELRGPQEPGADRITTLAALPDGGVAVRDPDHVLRVYGPDGTPRGRHPLRRALPATGYDAVLADRSGTVWVSLPPDSTELADSVAYPRPVYRSLPGDGSRPDTIRVGREFLAACPHRSHAHFQFGWYEDLRVRYFPKVKWALAPDGTLVAGCPADYRFDIVPDSGPRVRVMAEAARARVSDEERSAFAVTWTVQLTEAGRTWEGEDWSWIGPAIPTEKPAYHRLLLDLGGERVWVWRAGPSDRVDAPGGWPLVGLPAHVFLEPRSGAFDVFGTDGSFQGRVPLPPTLPYTGLPDTPDPVLRGDTVWAITADSLGTQGVARYVVRWPGSGRGADES